MPPCPCRGCGTGRAKICLQTSERTFLVVPPRNDSLSLWNEAQQEEQLWSEREDRAQRRPRDARGAGWGLHGWEVWDPGVLCVPGCSAASRGRAPIPTAVPLMLDLLR